ncbi:nonribosomal brevianamide peptide synthase FtmA [Trichophyton verrucosum HKI 0517]|uniref:Nonribosomal brevianamide peptide synthase FtmA n=1 Tax=Trichophyton verrucosum (strain HKI 0517) TaxID=663202 RepID=D4DER2_TRIVH|nr:nonribosomal brevianamide peptide synthase FtmA [Trichophyton verrucosum HKI 0517]EFE39655.1 nonribosomal brevianamide peptide synthase FtmA [Trichophyton verrucosum HKI 0517]
MTIFNPDVCLTASTRDNKPSQSTNICVFPKLNHRPVKLEHEKTGFVELKPLDLHQSNVCLKSTLKIAWSILLARYTDTNPVAFRTVTRYQRNDILGIGCGHSDTPSCFEQLVASIDEQKQGFLAVSLSQIEDSGYNASFNTGLLFGPCESLQGCDDLKGLEVIVNLNESAPVPRISLWYSRYIVDDAQARNLASELERILKSLIDEPHCTLADHNSIISNHHLQQIISWNSQAPSEPLDTNIPTLIRQQCLMRPNSQAVCSWDGDLTYRELDRLSSVVQAKLRDRGIGLGAIVPLQFEKSKWTPVAILGVLKAGAAFVLLDPSYPRSRTEAICRDIEATVIISFAEQRATSSSFIETVIVVDNTIKNDERIHIPRQASVRPDDVAYIAYTSGSTGVPKGIMIEHASFCLNSISSSNAHNLDHSSRVLQFASYAFDVSIHENLTPLILGGCVCIPSESQRVNQLQDAIVGLGVNWMELTPSVARLLRPEDIPSVKTLVLGGEAMLPADISMWSDKVRLVCAYGPAECTVVSTVLSEDCQPGNIGRSYAGTCWIVDKDNHHQLVPIGVTGELVIGGFIVGRGYLNRPQQTASAFIQNPDWIPKVFPMGSNMRLYKTGDLARYNSDGTIMCQGRKDTQVKLHGQRIELGEVEHHTQKWFPDSVVAAEVVVPASQKEKSPSLVLFVAEEQGIQEHIGDSLVRPLNENFRVIAQEMKDKLRDELPRYMIPTAVLPLVKMPLSRTGKIDRKILRNAVANLPESDFQQYRSALQRSSLKENMGSRILKAAPTTDSERLLQKLYSKVLGLSEDEVGREDSFFELGGDSISAITLVGMAREEYNLQIKVASLFAAPAIYEMAQTMEFVTQDSMQICAPFSMLKASELQTVTEQAIEQCQISRDQIEDIYGCTPLQEGLMSWSARNPGSFQARFIFRLPDTIDTQKFHEAWCYAFNSTPILRTRIIQTDASFRALQVIVKDKLRWFSSEDRDVAAADPMSYGTPLVRCIMDNSCHQKNEAPIFTLEMHHALFDKWSYEQILQIVEVAYESRTVELFPFSPFVHHLSAVNPEYTKTFWKNEFQSLKAPVFPLRMPEGYVPREIAVASRNVPLGASTGVGGFTASTLIRLSWAMLIAQDTQSNDVVHGATVTGRNAPVPGIEKIVGPTIATFPVRTVLDRNDPIKVALGKVQNHATALIPFEQTAMQGIRSCSPEASIACDFQSLLVIQPSSKNNQNPQTWLLKLGESLEDETKFCTYVLTVICELEVESVSVRAIFDAAVLSLDKVNAMLGQLEYLLTRLVDSVDSQTLGEVMDMCKFGSSVHDECKVEQLNSQKTRLAAIEAAARNLIGNRHVYAEMITPKLMSSPRKTLALLKRQLHTATEFVAAPPICIPLGYMWDNGICAQDRQNLKEALTRLTSNEIEAWLQKSGRQQPKSEAERKLASIISRVLHLNPEEVGADEDFFALGGDSISVMQVVSQCQRDKLSITAMDIFEGRTVSLITARSKKAAKLPPSTNLARYKRTKRFEWEVENLLGSSTTMSIEEVYPCTPYHEGLVIPQLGNDAYVSHTIWKVERIGSTSQIDPVQLQKAWYQLAQRHAALRTILVEAALEDVEGGTLTHVVLDSYPREVKILSCTDDEAMRVLRHPTLNSRDNAGPVLPHVFSICQTDTGQVYCKMEGKHAIIDAVSVILLIKELALAYEGKLPSRQGLEYSSWVSYALSLPDCMDFWLEYLAGAKPCHFPRLSREIQPVTGFLNSVEVSLGHPSPPRKLCALNGLTITNLLQIAWGIVLRQHTGSDDVCFGTLVTGREAPLPGVHDIVGSIFNVLACRLTLSENMSLRECLQENQVAMANRLSNQYCSLFEVMQRIDSTGSLFNTCLSVEQPLSNSNQKEPGVHFEALETREATEYDIVTVVTVGEAEMTANITYWSSVLTREQAIAVGREFRLAISTITEHIR